MKYLLGAFLLVSPLVAQTSESVIGELNSLYESGKEAVDKIVQERNDLADKLAAKEADALDAAQQEQSIASVSDEYDAAHDTVETILQERQWLRNIVTQLSREEKVNHAEQANIRALKEELAELIPYGGTDVWGRWQQAIGRLEELDRENDYLDKYCWKISKPVLVCGVAALVVGAIGCGLALSWKKEKDKAVRLDTENKQLAGLVSKLQQENNRMKARAAVDAQRPYTRQRAGQQNLRKFALRNKGIVPGRLNVKKKN